jgi:hypothetical protein
VDGINKKSNIGGIRMSEKVIKSYYDGFDYLDQEQKFRRELLIHSCFYVFVGIVFYVFVKLILE